LAEAEDAMWYFYGVHGHVKRALRAVPPGSRLRDAGRGTVGLIRRLMGWDWTRIDRSPLACDLARSRTEVAIVEGTLTKLPFAPGTFAAVTSVDVLYHIEDDLAALREVARVLRPGGTGRSQSAGLRRALVLSRHRRA
jgi:SAM-dependent methyltransferase